MKTIHLILLGILFGFIIFIFPGGFFLLTIVSLILFWVYKPHNNDTRFSIKLFLSAFIVRLILLTVITTVLLIKGKILSYRGYPGWSPILMGDEAYYTLRGYWMALDWKGFDLSERVLKSAYNPIYGWNGYTYVIALFHYLFGFSPVSCKIINCIFASLSGVLSYFIAKQYLTDRVAKLSGILVAFLPSMMLWSISNLKDSSLIFITLLILWAFIMFHKKVELRSRLLFFFLIVIGLLAQSTLRQKVMPLTLASLLISYAIIIHKPSLLVKIIVTFFCITGLLFFNKFNLNHLNSLLRQKICQSLAIHQPAALQEGSSNYKILEDGYYLINKNFRPGIDPEYYWYVYRTQDLSYLEYIKILIRGWVYFLFEPFPWVIDTGLKLLAYPQMVLWYILSPFALLGALIVLRYRWREYLILFIYFFIISSGCALTMANIGTAFRFRDMVTPVFLLCASVGLAKILGWKILKV